jgi:protein-disulfide isomerase
MRRLRRLADLAATLGIAGASVVLMWSLITSSQQRSDNTRRQPAPRVENVEAARIDIPTDQRVLGDRGAKLAVVEFADYQCPYCGTFARETFPQLKDEFMDKGQVAYAFINVPLEGIHPLARRAAVAAECAGEQHQFVQMHGLLFGDQARLKESDLIARADALGLDRSRFDMCMAAESSGVVERDAALARRVNVSGTPVFFIGYRNAAGIVRAARRMVGAQGVETFRTALKELQGGNGVAQR